jgi:hypothetical protein
LEESLSEVHAVIDQVIQKASSALKIVEIESRNRTSLELYPN